MATNALIEERSPYLRQHAHNPVNWLPWGEAAFRKAKTEDKPLFLSIGYSTCHWCHVMAHESFEDEGTAAILNREFVPVKVDREERPDVDRIYMLFVQASTGSGGWPMSVWLTPDLEPFFGGTYFPPDTRYGRPGFKEVLEQVARAWKTERSRVETSGKRVTEQLRELSARSQEPAELGSALFEAPFEQFRRIFDAQWGGFGTAPKFPRPVALNYLLRLFAAGKNEEALEMATQTLMQMAAGGMHDQLGGGFHRYSVDERWFVPHFEKMLYDQAQLAVSYLEAYQITRDERMADVARDIFSYVLRDLRDEEGGFYSAEDADSADPAQPGHSGEGAFYIWTAEEIERLVGRREAVVFARHYGVEPTGNVINDPQGEFGGRNILYEAVPQGEGGSQAVLEHARRILFEAREKRPRPHLDNKILTSWNGLMISALAKGFVVLDDEKYRDAAEGAMRFLLGRMYEPTSELVLRRFCEGEAAIEGFLDDYAFLAQALLDLFEATFNPDYLERAVALAGSGFGRFEDVERGGFYSTGREAPDLLLQLKEDYDGAEPTGNSVATDVLLRLAHLTGKEEFEQRGMASLRAAGGHMKAQPSAAPQLMVALGRSLVSPAQTVFRCKELEPDVLRRVREEKNSFNPNAVTLAINDDLARRLEGVAPFLSSLERRGRLTIYRCENFACQLPEVFD